LTLILDGYQASERVSEGHVPTHNATPHHDVIFDYFAAQVFERLPIKTREFLLATAVLPQVPVTLACELTGNMNAKDILEDLYKRHLFTHRRTGEEPIFWYHALFREFLQAKSRVLIDGTRLRETRRRAARLLEARQDFDDAFQLFHYTRDWSAARRLIERHAETLLGQGRGSVLRDWMLALPNGIVEDAPWLRYWLGMSLIVIEQKEARSQLERAFGQFAAQSDHVGQALSAAGVVDSYFFEWSDFKPMRRWVDTLEPLLERSRFSISATIERRIFSSLLIGMLYVAPGHRLLPYVVDRVTEMLDEDMDVNTKVSIAHSLLSYGNIACDIERAKIAIARAEPLLGHPDLTPFNRVWWYLRKGYYCSVIGAYQEGLDALDSATRIGEEHGLLGLRRTILLINSYQISECAMVGDMPNARKWHERMLAVADPELPMDQWHVTQSRAHLECTNENYDAVAEYSRKSTEEAAVVGMPYIEILGVEHEVASLAIVGETQRLEQQLSRLRRMIIGTCFEFLECEARLIESYVQLVHGSFERGRKLLKEALVFARENQFFYTQMARYSTVTGYLFAEALREGVEVGYVTDVIRRLQIRPPIEAPESWPWPIRIRTLGSFEVFRDSEKLEFSGRAPRKVLALLREIVAGGGEPVASSELVDALWADEEGDAARKSLDVSLVRLRKLLGGTDTVVVRDEHVSLNPDICCVDAWTFNRLGELAEHNDGDPERLGARALQLYRGSFLPGEDKSRQIVVGRLKLRDKLVRLVSALGRLYEDEQAFEKAVDCYRHGIEADELAEEFYQGVMRCHAVMGRPAEGMAAYRRLRQTLSVVLGVRPSESSEQLKQLLGNAGSRQQ
jgi:DNA-binding SARP family transcriptional activator